MTPDELDALLKTHGLAKAQAPCPLTAERLLLKARLAAEEGRHQRARRLESWAFLAVGSLLALVLGAALPLSGMALLLPLALGSLAVGAFVWGLEGWA